MQASAPSTATISLSVSPLDWGGHPLSLRPPIQGLQGLPPGWANPVDMDPNQNSRSPQPNLAYSLHGADAVRVPGLAADISQQIAKYDSSEFDDDKEVSGGDAEGRQIIILTV